MEWCNESINDTLLKLQDYFYVPLIPNTINRRYSNYIKFDQRENNKIINQLYHGPHNIEERRMQKNESDIRIIERIATKISKISGKKSTELVYPVYHIKFRKWWIEENDADASSDGSSTISNNTNTICSNIGENIKCYACNESFEYFFNDLNEEWCYADMVNKHPHQYHTHCLTPTPQHKL